MALEVAGLGHRIGAREILRDVGFAVRRGGFTVLLGLNGAGKTTLFSLVTRLYHGTAGQIRVLGRDMHQQPLAALAAMGVVFQQPTLDLDLSVEQNLEYHAAMHGMARRAAAMRIGEELARVGLAERRHERVRALSGGLRRRAELARALVPGPRLLLLDEPTVGLDVESRRFLLGHVRGLCRQAGLGVLWATHLIDEAGPGSDVVVLHQGRVLARGSRDEVVAAAGAADLGGAFQNLVRGE